MVAPLKSALSHDSEHPRHVGTRSTSSVTNTRDGWRQTTAGWDSHVITATRSCPSNDHVDERLVSCVTKGSAQSLAANCDDLTLSHFGQAGNPSSKRFLKCHGTEDR